MVSETNFTENEANDNGGAISLYNNNENVRFYKCNFTKNVAKKNGKIYGDVNFDSVLQKTDWVTPTPGGTGPMTVACLLENTYILYKQHTKYN